MAITYNEIKLTEGQIKQLFNDPAIQGKIKEYKPDREEAHKKWVEWLNTESLEKISDDELKNKFIEYYDRGAGRHTFIPINRDRIIRDIKKFRETLKFLLNESIDIKQRINEVLENDGKYKIEGVGKALVTSFLFDFNPDKYCIWNNRVEIGLEKIGWKPQLRGKMGEKYSQILETLEKLKFVAPEPYNNFNDIDTFLHIIVAEEEGENALRRIIEREVLEVSKQFEITEKALREILERNLTRLLPGFSVYEDEENRGIEYPTSVGRIDMLAIKDKEMLVIELKSGIASIDALKILSYMQWVEDNLAEGKKVKGLIIAQEIDDKLKYALKRIPDVEFKKYGIDFKLE